MDTPALRMVWIDLEMTGLTPKTDHILEIAVVVTDQDLNVLSEGPSRVVHQTQEVFEELPEAQRVWLHERGLIEDSRASAYELGVVEEEIVQFLNVHIERGQAPLCGNTISKDRAFLEVHMPRVVELLHYRNIDVSSVKELARRWRPDVLEQVHKKEAHRARDDILESIEELRQYKKHFFSCA